MLRSAKSAVLALLMAFHPVPVHAQNTTPATATSVEALTDVNLQANPASNSTAQSGGNVFDFSNKSGKNTPSGPSLPSFAGGACMGVSGGVSAAGPGFAIGAGRSFEDESCQRRNWVQTLVGVAQHMPPMEANELKRVAIALMMQDAFVGPAFEALGYDTSRPGQPQKRVAPAAADAAPRGEERQQVVRAPVRGAMNAGCSTVVPANASNEFRTLLEKRGCAVQIR